MATISHKSGPTIDLDRFPQLRDHFSAEQIESLLSEDMWAGRTVCGVLIAVITAGLLLGIGAFVAVLLWYV